MSVCALTLLMFINICIWYILHGGEAYYIGCSDCGDDNVKQPANDRLGLKKTGSSNRNVVWERSIETQKSRVVQLVFWTNMYMYSSIYICLYTHVCACDYDFALSISRIRIISNRIVEFLLGLFISDISKIQIWQCNTRTRDKQSI